MRVRPVRCPFNLGLCVHTLRAALRDRGPSRVCDGRDLDAPSLPWPKDSPGLAAGGHGRQANFKLKPPGIKRQATPPAPAQFLLQEPP